MIRRLICYATTASLLLIGACNDDSTTSNENGDEPGLRVPSEFSSIQEALDASTSGDEVVLAPGLYSEQLVVPAWGVTIRSASDDPTDTILDGSAYPVPDSLATEDDSLILFDGETSELRTLRGVSIRQAVLGVTIPDSSGASVFRIENCRFVANGPVRALEIRGGSLELVDCEFIDNQGIAFGGAIRWLGQGSVRRCNFRGNESVSYRSLVFTQAGAIMLAHASGLVEIIDNSFESNRSTDYGGALWVPGEADCLIRENRFVGNVAGVCAGAIYLYGNRTHEVVIAENLFEDNESELGGSIGIENSVGTRVINNTIVGSKLGEGIRTVDLFDGVIEGNLIAFSDGAAIQPLFSSIEQSCNLAFGNDTDLIDGTGNLIADPLFCDASAGDYTLQAESPCLPANNACEVQIGALGPGCSTRTGLELDERGSRR